MFVPRVQTVGDDDMQRILTLALFGFCIALTTEAANARPKAEAKPQSECKGLANEVCLANPVCKWAPERIAGQTLTAKGSPAKTSAKAHCRKGPAPKTVGKPT